MLTTVALLCYYEYSRIAASYGFGSLNPVGYAAGVLLLAWPGEAWPGALPLAWQGEAWLIVTVAALMALAAAMRGDLSKTLPRTALLVMGVVYVFGCWKWAIPLREPIATGSCTPCC